MENTDPTLPIYFIDDRNKANFFLKATKILYSDNDLCICEAVGYKFKKGKAKPSKISEIKEKMVFNFKYSEVYNPDYNFWFSTNEEPINEEL